MPRARANKLYRTFVKGLVTEAGYLTYPENASIDELNTVIKRKGSRSRRLGLDYEPSSTAAPVIAATTDVVSEFPWRAVDGDATVDFLVVQISNRLYFFDLNSSPISAGQKSFTVDLLSYKIDGISDSLIKTTACQMDCGKGYLFVAHEFVEPLLVDYDAATDTINIIPIIIQMRDFDGVNDSLANDEQPTTLSKEHMYNLKNQGWVKPGSLGVVEGAGSTNPYTPPAPPTTTGDLTYIDPYTGTTKFYGEL